MEIFYYALGQRLGPVDYKSLLELRQRGTITPDTVLEIDGKRVKAGKVKGFFDDSFTPPPQLETPGASISLWGRQDVPPIARRSARSISSNQMKSYARELYQASESLSSVGDKYSGSGKMLLVTVVILGLCSIILGIGSMSANNESVAIIGFMGALIGIVLIPLLLFRYFRATTTGKIYTFLSHFGKLTAMQYLEEEEDV